MSSVKLDVIWSPVHHDKFVIWGPDITLYEVSRLKEIEKKSTFTQISGGYGATVVASQSAAGVRCVDVSALADQPEPLLALGHTGGRVTLSALRQAGDPRGLVGTEFVPRHGRPCNSVSWSQVETNLLAAGMEKHRSDHCILIWDINKGTTSSSNFPVGEVEGEADASGAADERTAPVAALGLSETAHSVGWARCSPRTLLASINLKYIKLFDLRDWSNKAVVVGSTRYCYGACADPNSAWQVASRGENCVCVWDVRAFTRPLLTLHQPKHVAHLQWCPTRRNLLLSLQRDSNSLRLHDIQQASETKGTQALEDMSETETEEQYWVSAHVIERDVTPGVQPLAGFSWHPTHEARLLAVSHTGGIMDYTVCERVTVNWGAGGGGGGGAGAGLVWSAGGGALRLMRDDFYAALKDISYVMKRRAQTDYGLKADLWQNADLADDEALSGLWHFLALSKSLVEDGCIRGSPWRHPGVRSVLRPPGDGYRSEMVTSLLPDLPNRRVTLYRSVERTRVLQLCGWGWGWESAGAGVERAEAEGTPCRAAALAAFHLRLRTALDVLARAHEPQLRVVGLALAGLSEERLWREALSAAAPALPDAYLRALLHFLAATAPAHPPGGGGGTHQAAPAHPDLDAVLNETEMRLEDRVAFACLYLSDARLHEFVGRTADALVRQGDLAGMLLTGASTSGVELLQRWVETCGDVQSAALVAARCFTPDLLRMPAAAGWLHSYRDLLDRWQLWWPRCALDTWVCAAGGTDGAPRQVCAACTYCGKSVAAPPGAARPRPALARLPPPAAKMKQISSCPHCRKPLPRCAVCGLHVGAGAAARLAGWFSWCVACRHGGHAQHLLDWFKEHTECPVSSCNCRCSSLDPPDRSRCD